ncbi:polymeric immunoglobulin receptor-like [Brachyistius frenatus]|uniref:polymeric immunoglobulin receptor-like n=1 Tax=Brachyistius frenatus TaxID=100188 RepID=UPI0037E8EFC4
MWSLQSQLFVLCISVSCVAGAAGLILLFGYEGRHINVSCSYAHGYESYEKYLCKGNCGNSDVLIMTPETRKNKYSIHDDKMTRVFTATISDLLLMDAGKYWCGVSRDGTDIYTEVKLEVKPDSCCDNVVQIQSYEEGSVSIGCPYESENHNNRKYLCKGTQPSTCLQRALSTSDSKANTRFTLTDDKLARMFTVTVTALTLKDSGSYLCGVHTNTGLDVFTAVELEVKEWCCVKSKHVSGIVGNPVTLQCPYPAQHVDNRKFVCKGDERNNCTDVVTIASRFMLQDDISLHSFLVTVAQLEAGDAGTYWCGSDSRWGAGNYTNIHLSVVSLSNTIVAITAAANSTHLKGAALSLILTAATALLVLIVALVIVYKCKGAEVFTDRNKPEEVMQAADIYGNQKVAMFSKRKISQQQRACGHYDDVDSDQPDYENFMKTEEIYCNESFHEATKR